MPTTTTGIATSFITFSRTSNATVNGSDGLIRWAGHNLLTNSEAFNASAWAKTSATITANSISAPNGTTTADTIAASGANGTALQTWTAENVPYTFGVWLRRKTGTGNIQIAADNGTYTTVSITSSWALYTVTQTPAAGSKSAGIRIVTSGDEVYAWGAHLYRSDLAGMVLNPASGDSYYPTTPRNLLGFTEDFSNAAWTKSQISAFGSGSVSNAIVSPNKLLTADLLVASSTNAVASQVFTSIANNTYTLSVYAKAGTISTFEMGGTNQGVESYRARFDLSAVTATNIAGSTVPAITSVGDGWYRCSLQKTVTAGNSNDVIQIYIGNFNATVAGNSLYLWGAQISDSASLDSYSPAYGAAAVSAAYYAPRLDYNSQDFSSRGLLFEEQRANLLYYSNEFNDGNWQKTDCTITANQVTGPDGTLSAELLTTTGTTNPNIFQDIGAFTAGSPYTASIWVRAGNTSTATLQIFRNGGGTVLPTSSAVISGPGTIQVFSDLITVSGLSTSQWTRISMTGTPSSGGTLAVYIKPRITGATIGDTIYIWGAQLELGGFPTSYILSRASQSTRTADVASVPVGSIPYNSSEGTIVLNYQPAYDPTGTYRSHLSLSNSTPETRMQIRAYVSSGNLLSQVQVIDTTLQAEFNSGNIASPYINKVATALKANDFAASFNGGTVQTDTSGTFATDASSIMFLGGPFNIGSGYIRQITYIPRRISNSELQVRSA